MKMPLPPALAAKLAKRGITIPQNPPAESVTEEIIAEDYDDSAQSTDPKQVFETNYPDKDYVFDIDINFKIKGYESCPNKYNIYHDCSKFCIKKWKDGIKEPTPRYCKQRERLLEKYPIPETWKEVYDKGVGRYYYWDTINDLVSWLPPSHPKADPSECAASLREERVLKEGDNESEDSGASSDADESDKVEITYESKSANHDFKRPRSKEDFKSKKKPRFDGRSKTKDNDIDPMDPSAYSDVPRGSWSSGLENRGEAKTGVDITATGPLFQMRPYPSPGAILMANNKNKPPPPEPSSAANTNLELP